jgi:hypothetical protein
MNNLGSLVYKAKLTMLSTYSNDNFVIVLAINNGVKTQRIVLVNLKKDCRKPKGRSNENN